MNIGIDLGGTNVRAGLVDEGNVLELESRRIDSLNTESDVIDAVLDLIGELAGKDVNGIGIGVPSVVDTKHGVVYDVQNLPGWDEVPLKDIIEKKIGISTFVNNDANCFALGENYFGKGKNHDSFIAINIGTGFAGGIIIHNNLYEGHNCGAGEFGTVPFGDSIMEHYCAGLYFQRQHKSSGEKLHAKAEKGDLRARAAFRDFGKYVGFVLNSILYNYDPQAIILGGSVTRSYPFFRDSMMSEMQDFAFPKTIENLTIEISENENIAVLGAAALCL